MRVERLVLKNFRGIRDMDLAFHPQLTVLAGPNGAGKSSILDALAGLFGHCLHRINDKIGCNGECLKTETTCGCTQSQCLIHVRIVASDTLFVWGIGTSTARPGEHGTPELIRDDNAQRDHKRLASMIRTQTGLPIVVLFPPDRLLESASERPFPREPDATLPFERKYPKESAYTDALHNHKRFHWLVHWFKDREEIEVRGLRDISYNTLHKLRLEGQSPDGIDQQLEAVRTAIERFTGLKSPRFLGDPLRLVASKGETILPVTRFSEGEKGLFAMVGDLARRLAIANPALAAPLEGRGIVMIDEIDLHLHPAWQRMVIPRLLETFPNLQFMVTTHSPQVLGEIKSENIVLLQDTAEGVQSWRFSREVHGMDSGLILEAMMGTSERSAEVGDAIREAFAAIEDNDLAKAKEAVAWLTRAAKDIPELERIGMRLRRKEAIGR